MRRFRLPWNDLPCNTIKLLGRPKVRWHQGSLEIGCWRGSKTRGMVKAQWNIAMDNLQLSPKASAKGAVQRLDGGGLASANLRYSLAVMS
jgi:hypothetical protein